ncbi:chitin-binding domain-containing protein [Sedimentitalea nanhaiensis]|uniref:chitin-binding domain-containing protein n=1 Tax=Sedimentitalea nanhaiensis TaxID=999627 RepID=UPI0009DDAD7C
MTLRTGMVALALIVAPSLSFAMCSERDHQAQSCAPGTTWDSTNQSCVPQTNS